MHSAHSLGSSDPLRWLHQLSPFEPGMWVSYKNTCPRAVSTTARKSSLLGGRRAKAPGYVTDVDLVDGGSVLVVCLPDAERWFGEDAPGRVFGRFGFFRMSWTFA